MKKKLNLEALKVQSFITSPDKPVIGGGTQDCYPATPDTQTAYSCLAYISCHIVGCVVNSNYNCPDTRTISYTGLDIC